MTRDADLMAAEHRVLYSQERLGAVTRQSCGLGLLEEFDDAPDGPRLVCAAATGAAPVAAPVTPEGASPQAPVVSSPRGASLPATGSSPVLALGALLVLGALALTRRSARR